MIKECGYGLDGMVERPSRVVASMWRLFSSEPRVRLEHLAQTRRTVPDVSCCRDRDEFVPDGTFGRRDRVHRHARI